MPSISARHDLCPASTDPVSAAAPVLSRDPFSFLGPVAAHIVVFSCRSDIPGKGGMRSHPEERPGVLLSASRALDIRKRSYRRPTYADGAPSRNPSGAQAARGTPLMLFSPLVHTPALRGNEDGEGR